MTEKPGGYVPVMNHSEIAVFNRHGPIVGVYIVDDGFVINGYIEVGDPISKVYDLGGKFKTHDYGDGDGGILWCPPGRSDDWIVCPEFTYNENGIIDSISFWSF